MLNPFKPFQNTDDKIFTFLIKEDFSKDLEAAAFLISIPEEKRDDIVNSCLNDLRQKYINKNPKYKYVSKHLRARYDDIEKEMWGILYN